MRPIQLTRIYKIFISLLALFCFIIPVSDAKAPTLKIHNEAPIKLEVLENNSAIFTKDPVIPTLEEEYIDSSEWFEIDMEVSKNETQLETVPLEKPTIEQEQEQEVEIEDVFTEQKNQNIKWYSDYRVTTSGTKTTVVGGEGFDINFLAKMLYAEAGDMSWEGQVYTCSAILNFCDRYNKSLWDAGHTKKDFAVAPYVDDVVPNDIQYEVIEYVLSGGRIEEINHFRTKKYHSFGKRVCEVDGHYFSIN